MLVETAQLLTTQSSWQLTTQVTTSHSTCKLHLAVCDCACAHRSVNVIQSVTAPMGSKLIRCQGGLWHLTQTQWLSWLPAEWNCHHLEWKTNERMIYVIHSCVWVYLYCVLNGDYLFDQLTFTSLFFFLYMSSMWYHPMDLNRSGFFLLSSVCSVYFAFCEH